MIAILPYGGLTTLFPEPMEAVIHDLPDAINAMKMWNPKFTQFLHENPDYCVVVSAKDKQNPRQLFPEFWDSKFDEDIEEIHIFPYAEGATGWEAFYAAFAAFAATWYGAIIIKVAIALAVGAVMQALAPKPKMGQSERPQDQPSFLFNGPENVQEQGYMLPIVYGTHMTGSVIVSAGIRVKHVNLEPTVQGNGAVAQPGQWTGNPNNEEQNAGSGGE